jgi:hypothetical protein
MEPDFDITLVAKTMKNHLILSTTRSMRPESASGGRQAQKFPRQAQRLPIGSHAIIF